MKHLILRSYYLKKTLISTKMIFLSRGENLSKPAVEKWMQEYNPNYNTVANVYNYNKEENLVVVRNARIVINDLDLSPVYGSNGWLSSTGQVDLSNPENENQQNSREEPTPFTIPYGSPVFLQNSRLVFKMKNPLPNVKRINIVRFALPEDMIPFDRYCQGGLLNPAVTRRLPDPGGTSPYYYNGDILPVGKGLFYYFMKKFIQIQTGGSQKYVLCTNKPISSDGTNRVSDDWIVENVIPNLPLDLIPVYWIWAFFVGQGMKENTVYTANGNPYYTGSTTHYSYMPPTVQRPLQEYAYSNSNRPIYTRANRQQDWGLFYYLDGLVQNNILTPPDFSAVDNNSGNFPGLMRNTINMENFEQWANFGGAMTNSTTTTNPAGITFTGLLPIGWGPAEDRDLALTSCNVYVEDTTTKSITARFVTKDSHQIVPGTKFYVMNNLYFNPRANNNILMTSVNCETSTTICATGQGFASTPVFGGNYNLYQTGWIAGVRLGPHFVKQFRAEADMYLDDLLDLGIVMVIDEMSDNYIKDCSSATGGNNGIFYFPVYKNPHGLIIYDSKSDYYYREYIVPLARLETMTVSFFDRFGGRLSLYWGCRNTNVPFAPQSGGFAFNEFFSNFSNFGGNMGGFSINPFELVMSVDYLEYFTNNLAPNFQSAPEADFQSVGTDSDVYVTDSDEQTDEEREEMSRYERAVFDEQAGIRNRKPEYTDFRNPQGVIPPREYYH